MSMKRVWCPKRLYENQLWIWNDLMFWNVLARESEWSSGNEKLQELYDATCNTLTQRLTTWSVNIIEIRIHLICARLTTCTCRHVNVLQLWDIRMNGRRNHIQLIGLSASTKLKPEFRVFWQQFIFIFALSHWQRTTKSTFSRLKPSDNPLFATISNK